MADDENARLREKIERRAYERFCDRGCQHGSDLDDWLAAEREVLGSQHPAEADDRARTDSKPRRIRTARG